MPFFSVAKILNEEEADKEVALEDTDEFEQKVEAKVKETYEKAKIQLAIEEAAKDKTRRASRFLLVSASSAARVAVKRAEHAIMDIRAGPALRQERTGHETHARTTMSPALTVAATARTRTTRLAGRWERRRGRRIAVYGMVLVIDGNE